MDPSTQISQPDSCTSFAGDAVTRARRFVDGMQRYRDHAMKLGRPCTCPSCTSMDEDFRKFVEDAQRKSPAPEEVLRRRLELDMQAFEALGHVLDDWADNQAQGGWSTNLVDPLRRQADKCRRDASIIRRLLEGAPNA